MERQTEPVRRRGGKGFRRTSALVEARIRKGAETRGFAVHRLLTRWAEIAGDDVARVARPVEVSYGRGFGATLTLLTTGAEAPMLEMQKDGIRERVNACYGYAAISRVRITQTAPNGFADGQVAFAPKPRDDTPSPPDPKLVAAARETVGPVGDPDLRAALEALGANILSRRNRQKRPEQ